MGPRGELAVKTVPRKLLEGKKLQREREGERQRACLFWGTFRVPFSCNFSSGASRDARRGVATLKVRKGAFEALNEGSGAFGTAKLSPPRGRPLKNSMSFSFQNSKRFLAISFCRCAPWRKIVGVLLSAFVDDRANSGVTPTPD